jgi:hypothetical protein
MKDVMAASPAQFDHVPSDGLFVEVMVTDSSLERGDSLISLRDEAEDESYGMLPKQNPSIQSSRIVDSASGPPITVDDLRKSVLTFAHEQNDSIDASKTKPCTGAITRNEYVPIETRGRKRLLSVIRRTPHSDMVPIWSDSGPEELLTETSLCGSMLRDFMEERHVPRPTFLEHPIIRTNHHR